MNYESHTNNVMAVGFQCDGKWMYSGSEDGTVKIWDLRWLKDHNANRIFIFYSLSLSWVFALIGYKPRDILRAPGCQREYESRAAVNTVVLHPNQVYSLFQLLHLFATVLQGHVIVQKHSKATELGVLSWVYVAVGCLWGIEVFFFFFLLWNYW